MKTVNTRSSFGVGFWAVLLAVQVLMFALGGTATAKSVYLVSDHEASQFDAWNINPDGTVTKQATYTLQHATDPAGIGIDDDSETIFISSEFSSGLELVNPVTLSYMGVSTGPDNLAGVAVDAEDNIVYSVLRDANDLYVYDWDPTGLALTLRAGYPIDLPNCSGAFGLASDESTDTLWVADTGGGMVRAYNVSDLTSVTEDTSLSFEPNHVPVGIAVDRVRKFVYTVSMSLGATVPAGAGSHLLSKYDVTTATETTVDLGHQGVGVAVEETLGFVYITGDNTVKNLEVWDFITDPNAPNMIQDVNVGNPDSWTGPAGIAIGVGYNLLNLSKSEPNCYCPGETLTYDICYDNNDNDFDVHGVTITDHLPAEVSFLSATDGGIYDASTHSVTWELPDLEANDPNIYCVHVTVQVLASTPADSVLDNASTISSAETGPTTKDVQTSLCSACGEPCARIVAEIREVIAEKAMALQKINDACKKECEVYGTLKEMLLSRDYGPWQKRDILMAKTKTGTATSYQKNCEKVLNKSISLLEDLLIQLGLDPDFRQELEPCACQADGLSPAEIISSMGTALAEKAEALAKIEACMAREQELYETFEQLVASGDWCDWEPNEHLGKLKERIRLARAFEKLVEKMLEKSIDQLDGALGALSP